MKRYLYALCFIMAASLFAYADSPKSAAQLYEAAKKEFDANKFESSLSLYLKADSAYRAQGLGETAEYAQALHSTGRVYLNLNNLQKGRDYTRKAMDLREKLFGKVSEKYIVSLNNYALSFLIANELEEALKCQNEVINLCAKMNPPHPDEGVYLINLARVYHAMQDDDSAVKYMEEALPKVEKFSTDYEFALTFLGTVYMEKNDNENANRILGLSDEYIHYKLKQECNDPECHLERAKYYIYSGQTSNAKDEFAALFALPLSEDQKMDAYAEYAKFLYSQNDWLGAGEYYELASAFSESAAGENENAVEFMRLSGTCYFLGKDYDKAISAHAKVVESVDKNGYSEQLKALSLRELGNAYSGKGDYSNAIVFFKSLIEHLKLNGYEDKEEYPKAYERLAAAEKFNSDYDESIADYNIAIELYKKLGLYDKADQANNGLKMCLYYAKKGVDDQEENELAKQQNRAKIQETLTTSINILQQGGDYFGDISKAQSLATIAGCYAQLEDYEKAIDYYGRYLDVLRPAIAADFLLKNPKERELAWEEELDDITEMNEMIQLLPPNTPELFARLSTLIYDGQLIAKGILLSSNIEFDKLLSRYGTPEMKSQYEKVKGNLLEIEKMREEHRPVEEILAFSRATDELQLALARESATKGIYTNFLRYTCADVAEVLGDDEAAIEFVTLDTGILPSQNAIIGVVVSKEFPTGIASFIGEVGQIKSIIEDKARYSSNEYTLTIWGNLIPIIGGKKKVYFAPDGLLNNLAIEYMTYDGTPISELIDMSRVSSTREICREHNHRPMKFASLFGDIDYISEGAAASDKSKFRKSASNGVNFSNLENTKREISEIGKILNKASGNPEVFPYYGVNASKAEFLSQDELPISLMHIATHGQYINEGSCSDKDAMSRSVLAFAGANMYDNYEDNDGIVTASEISAMSLHDCDMVVLSACESGIGKLGNDGVFGLQRGFKNAGVKSLLVSLNEVADQSTADMMIAFYRYLICEKLTKHEALKKAQSDIRTRYPNDNTWASFILIDAFN